MENQQIKILIVDDEPDIREFISYNLIRKGYTVLTAGDGKEGLSMAFEFLPDLIILDIMMPFLNGYETCIRLRKTQYSIIQKSFFYRRSTNQQQKILVCN